ncbi:hypothetical protein [Lactobacillus iners]|uniref:hypothetical protein n=1 Tax=Lactobacillus iners TaxID=147802 RepID=UPI001F09402D|nr:hypothetical protein [Lactobacillus iners]
MIKSKIPEIFKYGSKPRLIILFITMVSNLIFNVLMAMIIGFITKVATEKGITVCMWERLGVYFILFAMLGGLMILGVKIKCDFEKSCLVKIKRITSKSIIYNSTKPEEYLSLCTNDLKFYLDHAIEAELNIVQNIVTFIISAFAAVKISPILFVVYFVAIMIPFIRTKALKKYLL